jgi:eukaryotic-like serine/threonine-protein kinase
MPPSACDRLGPYEILPLIGAGGMVEVYRARDTALKRDVALKVLPATFLRDPDRMARFQREAEVLASLDHPNIGHTYGIADSEDSHGLVLALVEGPTLAERIAAGPIPLDETVAISKQIIDALEYAHDRGVVHRDLKPANIKITPEGVVKVLDFGLAKVLEDEPPPSSLANSPTLTLGHTRTGVILGTAAYMSPEQAVGRPVDRRSDIFSFGSVLYEMLTGKRAFAGATTPDVLEAVVKSDPDWSKLPAGTPVYLRRLLERTLVKDRKQRLQATGEARIALENPSGPEPEQALPSKIGWMAAAAMTALAAVALWGWLKPAPATPRQLIHFIAATPQGIGTNPIAVSRDGSHLAFIGATVRQIYLRSMDDPVAKPVPGTENGSFPAFSPDGQWLAFIAGAAPPFQLKKVPIVGGSALTLMSGIRARAPMTWGEDGNILLGGTDVERVSEAGGQPTVIGELDSAKGELSFHAPQLLPGGKYVLANVLTTKGLSDFRVTALAVGTAEKKLLLEAAGECLFVPTGVKPGVGHLVYARNGSLFAATFNAATLQVGPAVPVLEGVRVLSGLTGVGFSRSGTLAYEGGGQALFANPSALMWVDRQGTEQALTAPTRTYVGPRISPDGGRVAFAVIDLTPNVDSQLWMHDVARGTTTRLTF